jgi:hypothetical protein
MYVVAGQFLVGQSNSVLGNHMTWMKRSPLTGIPDHFIDHPVTVLENRALDDGMADMSSTMM